MSDETVLPPDGIGADGKPTFVPSRYVRRETEALGIRIETDQQAADWGGKVGDWYVTDDQGKRVVMTDDDFRYYYREYEGASWPGKIAVQLGNNLSAHGCRAMVLGAEFFDADLNEWAEKTENFGKLVTLIQPLNAKQVVVLYTNTLSDRERAEVQEVSIETRRTIDERHKQALEDQAVNMTAALEAEKVAKEKALAEAEENRALIEAGRKHLANCKKAKL
jgi:hypothetical protein